MFAVLKMLVLKHCGKVQCTGLISNRSESASPRDFIYILYKGAGTVLQEHYLNVDKVPEFLKMLLWWKQVVLHTHTCTEIQD